MYIRKYVAIKITSLAFGMSSQSSSILISPRSVCSVTDCGQEKNDVVLGARVGSNIRATNHFLLKFNRRGAFRVKRINSRALPTVCGSGAIWVFMVLV